MHSKRDLAGPCVPFAETVTRLYVLEPCALLSCPCTLSGAWQHEPPC